MKKSIHYLFLFLFSGLCLDSFSQCTLSVTPTNISCHGANNGSANAVPSGGTAPYSYQWSTGGSNVSASNLAVGTYSVTVTNPYCLISGVELVINGNFSGGNTGFTSDYSTSACLLFPYHCLGPEGMYAVGTDPNYYNGGFFSYPPYGDHTSGSGNMMVVNGAVTANTSVWCETIPGLSTNTDYDFS